MKTYTSEDFKDFERINGTVICPAGDYSRVKVFEANCRFESNSKFGSNSEFGKNCNFGESCSFRSNCSFRGWCSFGERNSFGSNCDFGKRCIFGENCEFKESCEFGRNSEFGRSCNFGKWNSFGNCEFGKWNSFGEWCIFSGVCDFKENCAFENKGVAKTTTPFIRINAGSADRTSYAFNLENGIFVRSGCFFGTLEQFEDEVIRTHGDNSIHGKTYLMWIEIIKINFGEV